MRRVKTHRLAQQEAVSDEEQHVGGQARAKRVHRLDRDAVSGEAGRRVARARVLQRRPELLRREGEVHVHTSPARPERRHHGGGDDGCERQPGQLQADEQVVHG